MRLTDFTTLTFDCYGTLIDWEKGILNELRPWVVRHGCNLADDEILEAFGIEETRCEAATPDRLYPDILADVFHALAPKWQIPRNEEAARDFGMSVGRWPAFADSAPALQYLKRYYKLVILSNVDRASFARSNEKLQVSFDHIVTAQDVGSYKPSPRNFERLLADLADRGIASHQVLHTAQSLFHDVAPARMQGLATMWVNRRKELGGGWGATPATGDSVRPDAEVASMTDLVARHQADLRGEVA
jgi:2-haloalkanoic acid dehalogenase type II